jgi:hypothetical protein
MPWTRIPPGWQLFVNETEEAVPWFARILPFLGEYWPALMIEPIEPVSVNEQARLNKGYAEAKAFRARCRDERIKGKRGCNTIMGEAFAIAMELTGRFQELLVDKLDLYHLAYDTPNPALPPGSGSFLGHIEQIQNKQSRLRTLIKEADDSQCEVPQWVRTLASRPTPTQPRANLPR